MRAASLILGLVLASHSPSQSTTPFDFRRADNEALIDILRDLAVEGAYAPNETEIGAFIVRKTDGELSVLLWPRTYARRSARYDGAIPPGVVAMAHTHPLHFPRPSRGDVEVARRVGLPSYVVSRWEIYVIDPSSSDPIALFAHDFWTRSRRSKTGLLTH
jgi:proteasome lid subunit RPN8/RPN11